MTVINLLYMINVNVASDAQIRALPAKPKSCKSLQPDRKHTVLCAASLGIRCTSLLSCQTQMAMQANSYPVLTF